MPSDGRSAVHSAWAGGAVAAFRTSGQGDGAGENRDWKLGGSLSASARPSRATTPQQAPFLEGRRVTEPGQNASRRRLCQERGCTEKQGALFQRA